MEINIALLARVAVLTFQASDCTSGAFLDIVLVVAVNANTVGTIVSGVVCGVANADLVDVVDVVFFDVAGLASCSVIAVQTSSDTG